MTPNLEFDEIPSVPKGQEMLTLGHRWCTGEIVLLSIGTDVMLVVWLNNNPNGNTRARQVSGMNVTMRKCANAQFEIKIDATNHDME
jgi:hypothetical protein